MKKQTMPTIGFTWAAIDLRAEGVYSPGRPGRTSGPPEKCYPDEPAELDIEKLTALIAPTVTRDATFLLDSEYGPEIMELAEEALAEDLGEDLANDDEYDEGDE